MYIDYGKLWKRLIDKGMSKTDLANLTGISSRVLAKLSKNETVTTDTIARICAALGCDVGDIMECAGEERLSLYGCYKKYGKCTEKNALYKTVRFTARGKAFAVYVSLRAANKASHIICAEDGTVYWEQLYPIGSLAYDNVERSVFIKPKRAPGETVIVLIKGKPGMITGLDEGHFVSAHGVIKGDGDIYVMSEAAFKVFA